MKSAIYPALACFLAISLCCNGQAQTTLPTNEQRFFAPDNGVNSGDEFGGAVAADGEWAVTGARFDDSALISDEGSAYVLKWTAGVPFGSWKVHQKLTLPMTAQERDRQTEGKILFGQRVAISGEWMAISAPRFKTASGRLGRIVVYKRSGDTWEVAQIIEPENSYSGYTGAAMVISNDRLAFASNHGTVHVYSRTTKEAQPPWLFHTTIDVTTTSGETGLCLALHESSLLMGIPGIASSQGQSAVGHIREYEFRQFHVNLLATIPSPTFPQPNELKYFASSIAVSGDWLLVGSCGLSGSNAKVFCYRRRVAGNKSVTWELEGDTSVPETAYSPAPAVLMVDRYAVVTTFGSRSGIFRMHAATLTGPDFSSLQKVEEISPHSTRLQEYDLHQSAAFAGDTVLVADSSISKIGELVLIPPKYNRQPPQRLSPPQSYLTRQDGMGSTVAASTNLVAVSAPQWRPSSSFNAPTPQRGTVHLYGRTNGLWEYSDSVNNVVNGPTSPAFGQLMSVNSGWLAMNGQGGVYAYRLMDGKAADLPSFTIRPKTNSNATLLNLEFDPLNESTLIVAWKNGSSGTLVERFSMPTTEKEEPTFQSVLAQTGVSNSVPMAIEKGLAAVANGSEVSVYDTAINPWKRISGFSPEGGAIIPGVMTDGLFFDAGQILAKTSVGLRAYEEKSRKWMLRWIGPPSVLSARRDALLRYGDAFVSITRPKFNKQNTFPPMPQTLSLFPTSGRDQPRSPRSGVLTEDSAIVCCSDSAAGPLGMVWMRSLEDLKLYDGPVANPFYELLATRRQFMGNLAQHEPTDLQFTLTNAGELVIILSKEDFTLTASAQGTQLELVGWDEPRTIAPGSSMTFTLRVAPIAFSQNQTVDIVIRGPVSKRIVLNTGFSFTVAQFNPPVPEANLVEKANLVALGKSFSIRVGPEISRSLDLQWIKDRRLLKGQTFPVFSIDAVKASDAGVYQIRVQNRYGQSAIAGVYLLGVYDDQVILITKRRSDPISLSLNAWGPGIKVQWNEGQDTAFIQGSRTKTLRVSRASEISSPIAAYVTLGSATAQASTCVLNLLPETSLIWKNPTFLTLENGNPWPYGIQITVVGEEPLSVGNFKVSGLPPGITYDPETNAFQGTPTTVGSYDLIITGSLDGLPKPPPLKIRVQVNANPAAVFYPQGSWAGILRFFAPDDLQKLRPGMLKLTMTGVGRFSGFCILGDRRLSFTAQYRSDDTTAASAVANIRNYSNLGDLQLTFGYAFGYSDTGSDAIPVDISIIRNGTVVASMQESLKRVLIPNLASNRIVGRYSAFIEQAIDQLSVGSGLLSFSITANHDISSVGTFANGQGFTGSGTVLDNGSSKQLLHYAFSKPGDTLSGQTELGDDLTFQETKEMTWKSEPSPKSRLYAEGFELGVQLVGAKHFAPAAGMLLFGGIDQSTATIFSLAHPSLFPEPIQSPFRLTTQHSALFPAPNRNRLKMDFYAPTGFFTGSFETTDLLTNEKPFTRNANLRGIMIPGINRGGGFFLMPALPDPVNEPSVSSSQTPIYSGKVSLGISP